MGYDDRNATRDPVVSGVDNSLFQDIAWYLNSMLYCESIPDQSLD